MKKIKVLHILNELNYSAVEIMISHAASLWKNNGVETHILSTGKKKGNFTPKLLAKKCIVYHVPFKKKISFFLKIYELIKKKQFDIVHIQPERADFFYSLATRIALGYKVGIIRTVHHIFRFPFFLRLRKIIERKISLHILRVYFLSDGPSGKKTEKKYHFMNTKIIPCWYDDKSFVLKKKKEYYKIRKRLNIPQNVCLFLAVGKFTYYKNYNAIIDALSLIKKNKKILFIHIGGNKKILNTYINDKNENKRAKCLGNVKDLKKYLTAADVFIMPSLEEGFGVAAIEAMACGLPCILSNVIALWDFKKKNKRYLLCKFKL